MYGVCSVPGLDPGLDNGLESGTEYPRTVPGPSSGLLIEILSLNVFSLNWRIVAYLIVLGETVTGPSAQAGGLSAVWRGRRRIPGTPGTPGASSSSTKTLYWDTRSSSFRASSSWWAYNRGRSNRLAETPMCMLEDGILAKRDICRLFFFFYIFGKFLLSDIFIQWPKLSAKYASYWISRFQHSEVSASLSLEHS